MTRRELVDGILGLVVLAVIFLELYVIGALYTGPRA